MTTVGGIYIYYGEGRKCLPSQNSSLIQRHFRELCAHQNGISGSASASPVTDQLYRKNIHINISAKCAVTADISVYLRALTVELVSVQALTDRICEWFYGPALNGCFFSLSLSLRNVAVNCTMDSEALSHRAPRGGWMRMRMLFTKSSQPSAHWCSVFRRTILHLIFYDTFGNYCQLRLSSLKRAMSSSADRRGFVVVWFYYVLVLCNSTSRRLCKSIFFCTICFTYTEGVCLNHSNCEEIRPILLLTCVWKYNYKHLGRLAIRSPTEELT